MSKSAFMVFVFLTITSVHTAFSAIALDRTRVIYEGDNKAISLNISNENKQLPYLAQAWVEDHEQQKVAGPLIVTPPIQRLEPGAKSMVRISAMPEAKALPQDRETLFYFNLREIPPRSDKSNVMQIALQTKVKLFYRPASIVMKPGAVWQNELVLHKTATGYQIENPTPYYITVTGIAARAKGREDNGFVPVTLAPKSRTDVKSIVFDAPVVTYINDYGGRPELAFTCAQQRCSVNDTK
ncbi:fimbria/pilus periplasmic chaperone [Serratia fonticola]|uniref:fimbria/pilus periplasmic chaperone n=1 Tax=Serratia fonticola TaxID=47917 RepID=UPI00192BFC82|nr:fimbria/pilus periplasmic chaperone [Serratia fonticola]MBL5902033.1 fimbria/pilus periplasmic chaperone [Serratia fonticola]